MHTQFVKLVLAAGLLTLIGCGKAQEKAAEKLIEANLSADGAKVNVALGDGGEQFNISTQTEEGEASLSFGGQTKIPDNFPKDVPVYPGLQVMLAHQVAAQENFSIQGLAQDPVARVTEFYRTQAEAQGWKQEMVTSLPGMENLTLKKESRILSVSIVDADDSTSVTLTVARE